MSAPAGSLDPQPLAFLQAPLRLARQPLRSPIGADTQVLASAPGLAALGARRAVPPALGQERELHLDQRLQLPHDAVAAPEAPGASAAAPRITLQLLLGALAAGAILLFPSYYYLFRIFKGETAFTILSGK